MPSLIVKGFFPDPSKASERSSNWCECQCMNSLDCAMFAGSTITGYKFNLMATFQIYCCLSVAPFGRILSQASWIMYIVSTVVLWYSPSNTCLEFCKYIAKYINKSSKKPIIICMGREVQTWTLNVFHTCGGENDSRLCNSSNAKGLLASVSEI